MYRVALRLVFLWLVAAVTIASQETGSISVSSAGAPAAGVDIFVFVNQGKQPVGTTTDQGSLPFDPALLVGKLKGEVVERTCASVTEVILVAEGEDYHCESRDANGESCDCEPAGAWIFSNGRITVQMQSTAEPLVRNPVFLGAVGAGAVTGLVIAGGGDDSGSTVTRPTTSSSGTTGVSSAPEGSSSAAPSPTSVNGNYPGNFVLQRDECNFFVSNFNGTAVVQANPNGSLTLQIVESITRTYQGTLHLTSNGNGSGNVTGSGTIGNLILNYEARLTFTNGRLTVEETIRKPQGGNCAAIYRAENLARQ